jgi:hypothetical protein
MVARVAPAVIVAVAVNVVVRAAQAVPVENAAVAVNVVVRVAPEVPVAPAESVVNVAVAANVVVVDKLREAPLHPPKRWSIA